MLDNIKTKILLFWDRFLNDMALNRKIHGWLTIFWFLAAFPIAIFLSTSIPLLVFISVYAVVGFHWSLFFQTKIENKHEDESVAEDILDELDEKTDVVVKRK